MSSSPGGPCATKSSHRMILATVLPERTEPCQMLSRASASRMLRRCLPFGRASVIIAALLLSQPLHQQADRAAPLSRLIVLLAPFVEEHRQRHRPVVKLSPADLAGVDQLLGVVNAFLDHSDSAVAGVLDTRLVRLFRGGIL